MEDYTNGNVKLVIIWNICKIKSLFIYKDKIQLVNCVIYGGFCLYDTDYIGQTIINSETRWKEYSTGRDKNCDCVKHLNDKFYHEFRGLLCPVHQKIV